MTRIFISRGNELIINIEIVACSIMAYRNTTVAFSTFCVVMAHVATIVWNINHDHQYSVGKLRR